MGWPGVPAAAELEALGVRRLSSATGVFRAAYAQVIHATEAFLRDGNATALAAAGEGVPNLNARFTAGAS